MAIAQTYIYNTFRTLGKYLELRVLLSGLLTLERRSFLMNMHFPPPLIATISIMISMIISNSIILSIIISIIASIIMIIIISIIIGTSRPWWYI